jgi:hypothetical protein
MEESFIWWNDFILYFCVVKKERECFEKRVEQENV